MDQKFDVMKEEDDATEVNDDKEEEDETKDRQDGCYLMKTSFIAYHCL